MTTPKYFSKIDDYVYNVDSVKAKGRKLIRQKHVIAVDNQQFQVIKTIDANDKSNSKGYADNGFQAMAVSPVVNGHVDRSQTIVAYAGTNAQDPSTHDLRADIHNVVFGVKSKDSQFSSATQFYREVSKMKDVKVVSATGHSLGGALAQKVAAVYRVPAVTFSTAGVGSQLTSEEKAWLSGEGKDFVLNYMHKGDQVSRDTNAKGYGTAIYAGDFGSGALLSGHMLESYSFDKSGAVKDQSGVAIISPVMLKAIKSSYKKVVAPKIKSLKETLASGSVSGAAKIALQTELVMYTAKELRAKGVAWYEESVKAIEKVQNDYKAEEKEMIQNCQLAGGPLMSYAEAKSIYREIAGHKAYDAEQFTDALKEIKKTYQKQLKAADQMDKLVEETLARDQCLAQLFQ